MRKTSLIILLATAIFVSCNSSNTNDTTSTSTTLVVATDTATVKYKCPMKCEGETAYTTEGKCPVCEMDLEKINKEQNQ